MFNETPNHIMIHIGTGDLQGACHAENIGGNRYKKGESDLCRRRCILIDYQIAPISVSNFKAYKVMFLPAVVELGTVLDFM